MSADPSDDSCSVDSVNVIPMMPKMHQITPYIVKCDGSLSRLPETPRARKDRLDGVYWLAILAIFYID